MSKCHPNWQRLPNSRMDRQHRPRQFFRGKEQAVEKTEAGIIRSQTIKQDKAWKRAIIEKENQQ